MRRLAHEGPELSAAGTGSKRYEFRPAAKSSVGGLSPRLHVQIAAAATYGSKSGRIRFGSQIGRYFDNHLS
jgi:hypothetical protein